MEYPSRVVVLSVKFETNSKSHVEATKLYWEEIAKAFKRLISFNIFLQCYTLRWLFVPCTIYQIFAVNRLCLPRSIFRSAPRLTHIICMKWNE